MEISLNFGNVRSRMGGELVVLAKALRRPDQEQNNIERMRQQGLMAAGAAARARTQEAG